MPQGCRSAWEDSRAYAGTNPAKKGIAVSGGHRPLPASSKRKQAAAGRLFQFRNIAFSI